MDDRIKRIFRKRISKLNDIVRHSPINAQRAMLICAKEEIIYLYAEICNISYEAAAAELHEGDVNDED